MVKELFEDFKTRYTPNEIHESTELQTLYNYFLTKTSMSAGNYIHIPSEYLQTLIKKRLDYEYPEDHMRTK